MENKLPEKREVVSGTVKKLLPYGFFVDLDEYPVQGFVHISEFSAKFVKDIRVHVKEGDKVVAKVLRVDTISSKIDLSMRDISDSQKKKKLQEIKNDEKAVKMWGICSQRIGKDLTVEKEKVKTEYGFLYPAFEDAIEAGPAVFVQMGIDKKIAETLTEIARASIKIKEATIKREIELKSFAPDGVEKIRKAINEIEKCGEGKVEVHYVSAPLYLVQVTAKDYKAANRIFEECAKKAIKMVDEGKICEK